MRVAEQAEGDAPMGDGAVGIGFEGFPEDLLRRPVPERVLIAKRAVEAPLREFVARGREMHPAELLFILGACRRGCGRQRCRHERRRQKRGRRSRGGAKRDGGRTSGHAHRPLHAVSRPSLMSYFFAARPAEAARHDAHRHPLALGQHTRRNVGPFAVGVKGQVLGKTGACLSFEPAHRPGCLSAH